MMWVPGGLIFWLAMTLVWFRWSASEPEEEAEAIPLPPSPPGGAS